MAQAVPAFRQSALEQMVLWGVRGPLTNLMCNTLRTAPEEGEETASSSSRQTMLIEAIRQQAGSLLMCREMNKIAHDTLEGTIRYLNTSSKNDPAQSEQLGKVQALMDKLAKTMSFPVLDEDAEWVEIDDPWATLEWQISQLTEWTQHPELLLDAAEAGLTTFKRVGQFKRFLETAVKASENPA